MDLGKIEELIGALEGSLASELTVKSGESRVKIRRAEPAAPTAPATGIARPVRADAKPAVTELSDEAFVRAPMVGLFRAIDSLTDVGSRVSAGQIVGAIESMKLLNDIVCEVNGEVVESMVEDGMPVEYNQVLCRIKLMKELAR